MSGPDQSRPGRPPAFIVIGWLFIAAGAVGFLYHITELNLRAPLANDTLGVAFIRLLAIVGGAGLLRGRRWARWLVVAWVAFHVGVSAFHTHAGLLAHAALLVVVAWFLFRPRPAA